MVSGDDKYWFENGDKPEEQKAPEMPEKADTGAEKEDLFSSGTESSGDEFFVPFPEDGGDPHERHYQSDFAARFQVPPQQINAKGKFKAVRGSMLRKLLKYDYKALFRFLLPCYIALLALAALCAVGVPLAQKLEANNASPEFSPFFSMVISVCVLYVLGVFGSSIVCIFNIAMRFSKNLFGPEGYLTLSIPATPEEHIFSKLISSFTTILLTIWVAVVSVIIVAMPYGTDVFSVFRQIFSDLGQLFETMPVDGIFLAIELLLFLVIGPIFGLQVIYSCICIGQLFVNKNRAGAGLVTFVIYMAVSQMISSVFALSGFFTGLLSSRIGIHLLLWVFILLEAGGSVGLFFWERYVLKNKINLG